MILPGRMLQRAMGATRRLVRTLRYLRDRRRGGPAGDARYRFVPSEAVPSWCLELRLPNAAPDTVFAEGRRWADGQTLERLRVLAGRQRWAKTDEDRSPATFFYAPFYAPGPDVSLSSAPADDPAFAEAAALILAAEDVDAVAFPGARRPTDAPSVASIADLLRPDARRYTVFRAEAWRYDAENDTVRPTRGDLRAKVMLPELVEPDAPGAPRGPRRRGSYLASRALGPRADLRLRDAALYRRRTPARPDDRPRMLVTVPFLARGGAEHTLYETLYAMRERWHIAFLTLAPHRPEQGDRRGDFQEVWPRLLCLGDFVHPAAMPGCIASVLDAFEPDVLYNANSTTLFYDFLPELRRLRPTLRLVDHLYDHRVGYIERYRDPGLRKLVDAVVAENRRIQVALDARYGWPRERAPVVWPCGRPTGELPDADDADAMRRAVRTELGYAPDDVIVLTAARMHEQKRPLDLVRLAERVRDLERVHFLVVGGGALEGRVDRAVDEARGRGARLRRLPFRDDIPRLIVGSDVGCLVSDYEGLPVFLLECLQLGRPFLGTDVGDLGFVLRATGAGWVVDRPGDLDALERAVRRLADDGERAAKGAAALAAAPRFSVEACAERYDAVLRGEVPAAIELGDG